MGSIAKNTFWLSLAEGISKFFSVIQTLQITRYLGAEGYGVYSFALSFVSLFSIFADFGFGTLLVRDVARDKSRVRVYLINLTILKTILSLISLGLILFSTIVIGKSSQIVLVVFLAGTSILLQNFLQFFSSVYRAFEKMYFETVSKTFYSFLLFGLIQWVIYIDGRLIWLMYAFVLAAVFSLLPNILIFKRLNVWSGSNVRIIIWGKFLRSSWMFALSSFVMMIYFRIDVTMLSMLKNDNVVGNYSAAYNFIVLLNVLPTILGNAIFPYLSVHSIKGQSQLNIFKVISLVALIALPISLLIFINSDLLYKLLYGSKFVSDKVLLGVLLLSGIIVTLDRPLIDYLYANSKERRVIFSCGLVALLNILLNLFLIPPLGSRGSALATLICELALMCLLGYFFILNTRKRN